MKFEKYYQKNAIAHREVYIEVLFWKYFSKRERYLDKGNFDSGDWYNRAINKIKETSPRLFWGYITNFVENLKKNDLKEAKRNYYPIAENIGISDKLITPLTFVSLAFPETLPMIDSVVISWINTNFKDHNHNRQNQLLTFSTQQPAIEKDFFTYVQWVKWCQESAGILNNISEYDDWRPRDVEMAIFSYQLQKTEKSLEILT